MGVPGGPDEHRTGLCQKENAVAHGQRASRSVADCADLGIVVKTAVNLSTTTCCTGARNGSSPSPDPVPAKKARHMR
jgi:hypothetical protein